MGLMPMMISASTAGFRPRGQNHDGLRQAAAAASYLPC